MRYVMDNPRAAARFGLAARHTALLEYADDCEEQAKRRADQRAAAELYEEALIARLAAYAMEVTP